MTAIDMSETQQKQCLAECPNTDVCEHGYCPPHRFSYCEKKVAGVSSPTSYRISKFRWWIPRFIYNIIINDITEITVNYKKNNK